MFVLIYSNQDENAITYKARRYYLPKGFIMNYNTIINRKNIYDQPIDFDVKWYKEIRKLTTGQGEDYTTGCLLDYHYIKNHFRIITIDLSRQKKLDHDPKAIQQIEFVGLLKNTDGVNPDCTQSMFVLTNLEKIKKTRPLFFQGSTTAL